MANVSNWKKFKLLLWKNWLLQWNHKTQLALELLLPALFTMILVLLRGLVVPEKNESKSYEPVNITDLMPLYNVIAEGVALKKVIVPLGHAEGLRKFSDAVTIPHQKLLYSPKNNFVDQIMKSVGQHLNIPVSGLLDSKILDRELELDNYIAGVEFDDRMANLQAMPKNISFALRFPGDLRSSSISRTSTWQTARLFPILSTNYPRNFDEKDGGSPVGYLREGFLSIQNAISRSFIELASGNTYLPIVQMRRLPHADFIYDPLLEALKKVVSLVIVLSFIYPCTFLVKYIALEKEKQLKEVMKILGLANWIHWTAWFVKAFITFLLITIILLVLLLGKWSHDVAVLTYSSWSALLFFFLIYSISSIMFCFMLSVFFSNASTASAVTGLLWFISHLPSMFIMNTFKVLSWEQKICWCLLCNTAMAFGMHIVIGFESSGEGLQWNNMHKSLNVDDNLSLASVMAMMIISSLLYMLTCLYVEQVFPGKYGIPKKWYFLFTNTILYCRKKEPFESSNIFIYSSPTSDAFESEPKNKSIGLRIINLRKKFNKNTMAVKDLSLNMFQNEITVLLGHNGAGKTTVVSMLTGILQPTSGTAIISGYDIMKDLKNARSSMGICPQYNVLFNDLSVSNHIRFYCILRGLKMNEMENEVEKYLKLIDIESKANEPASQLSGGMQRKLSVCCALCGGAKVVLLDEPSSGLDPLARRHMWNLLQGEKNGRTILLTTHFMDEADILGDRIAIMHEGQLKCYGTSFFLKKKFGSGYKLICLKRIDECDVDKVTALLRQHMPDIVVASNIGAELTYRLPFKYANIFEETLKDLEENSEKIGLNGYGISIASMEEVFMKIGAETSPAFNLNNTLSNSNSDIESINSKLTLDRTLMFEKKFNIIRNQFRAMLLKKILNSWRNKWLLLLEMMVPALCVIIAIFVSRYAAFDSLPPLPITLNSYDSAVTMLNIVPSALENPILSRIAEEYEMYVKSFGPNYKFVETMGKPLEDLLLKMEKYEQTRMDDQFLAAATIYDDKITAWLNNQPLHTAPLTINFVYNAMARALIGPDANIEVINKPLKSAPTTRIGSMQIGESLGGQLALLLCFSMAFITSIYIREVVKENESNAKLQQLVAGVRIWIYWLSNLAWDMLTFNIIVLIVICILACFQEAYCSKFDELLNYYCLLITFGFAAISLSYLLSTCFKEPATGFARLSTISLFLGMGLFITIMVLSFPYFNLKGLADQLVSVFMFYPHFAMAIGVNELYLGSAVRELCNLPALRKLDPRIVCDVVKHCCLPANAFGIQRPGILSELLYMFFVGCFCLLIVIIRENQWIRNLVIRTKRSMKNRPLEPEEKSMDSDVANEKEHIAAMDKREKATQNLVLDRVTKFYGSFLAVNQISLCVKEGECFGLLGVNGAGKTTTFKILTGDEKLTYGKAYVKGYSVNGSMQHVYGKIGYCPQFDALLEDLTGRDMLRIFCLIKGVKSKLIKSLTDELALALTFFEHLDKVVRKYSGGNKRKLSTALAVLGHPSVLYLDEPTTGMDPDARRRLWDVICLVRDSGKAIVLTSHSMEECEALCTRLAIMVNGEFKCIGSIQHLKNKFSKGFILRIKVAADSEKSKRQKDRKRMEQSESEGEIHEGMMNKSTQITESLKEEKSDEEEEEEDDEKEEEEKEAQKTLVLTESFDEIVKNRIEQRFPTANLVEYYQGIQTYNIPLTGVTWSEVFGFMEKNITKLNIEDYTVTQATLEEIFLDFAKSQVDVRSHRCA